MEVLWLIPAVVILVGGFFMVKAFVRLGAAMQQMRQSLNDLGEMGPRLQKLGEEMGALNQAMDDRIRRSEQSPD